MERLALAAVVLGAAAATGLALAYCREKRHNGRLRQRLETATMELQRLQLAFARFAPEEVVERIAASGVLTAADKKEVTVLFADLRSFTQLGESVEPDLLVRILNGHFARMSRVIAEHRGHVSKFIGDGILALFGALDTNPWQSNDAVHAALQMQAALGDYNRELAARGGPSLRMGIGLHRGLVVAGIVGSPELMEFTVIGSTVNLAARVERLTRVHEADILITEAMRASLDPRFVVRPMPPSSLRGFTEPVVTFAVERFES